MNASWKRSSLILALGTLGLMLLGASPEVLTQEPRQGDEQMKDEVETLTRAPLHEAYAAPLSVNPQPTPIIPQKPPEPIAEMPPQEQPAGQATVWIGGYFAWDDESAGFIWISGFWRVPPPGKQWLPGHWRVADGGWQWVMGSWTAQNQSEVEYLPPPPVSLEVGPSVPAPSPDSIYSPGSWIYRQQRCYWRPGFWLPGQTDWVYVPAHYEWTPAGCLFVEGYWDYPLHRRGLLFAPVRIAHGLWDRPNWYYQPRYVVYDAFLLGALFVRNDFGRYYYGDYFAAGYGRHGFVPWTDYYVTRNTPGPLFGYYRWLHRNDRQWEPDLRTQFAGRRAGTLARPPATFAQQQEIIQNITVNNTVQIGGKNVVIQNSKAMIHQMTALAPLGNIDPTIVKLQPVSKTRQLEIREYSKGQQNLGQERRKNEAKLITGGTLPLKPTDPPHRVKVEFPKSISLPDKIAKVQPPPPPPLPKHIEKPLPNKQDSVKPIRLDSKPFPPPEGNAPPKTKAKDIPPPKTETPPPKAKEKDLPPPKAKEKDQPPPKTEPPPPKAKDKDLPPKSKAKDTPPPKTEIPPPKAKEKDLPPPRNKDKDKSPPKDKVNKEPGNANDLQSLEAQETLGVGGSDHQQAWVPSLRWCSGLDWPMPEASVGQKVHPYFQRNEATHASTISENGL